MENGFHRLLTSLSLQILLQSFSFVRQGLLNSDGKLFMNIGGGVNLFLFLLTENNLNACLLSGKYVPLRPYYSQTFE